MKAMKSYKIITFCSYSIFWIHSKKVIDINGEILSTKSKKYYTKRNVSFLFNTPLTIENVYTVYSITRQLIEIWRPNGEWQCHMFNWWAVFGRENEKFYINNNYFCWNKLSFWPRKYPSFQRKESHIFFISFSSTSLYKPKKKRSPSPFFPSLSCFASKRCPRVSRKLHSNSTLISKYKSVLKTFILPKRFFIFLCCLRSIAWISHRSFPCYLWLDFHQVRVFRHRSTVSWIYVQVSDLVGWDLAWLVADFMFSFSFRALYCLFTCPLTRCSYFVLFFSCLYVRNIHVRVDLTRIWWVFVYLCFLLYDRLSFLIIIICMLLIVF